MSDEEHCARNITATAFLLLINLLHIGALRCASRFLLFYFQLRFEKSNKEEGEIQVSSLIYAMGSEAEKIFSSFEFAETADKKKFDTVVKNFDDYFIPRRNIIHERACFYQRNQQPGETAEMYIRTLYEMAEHCEFGEKRDEHIRDRLVVGLADKELSRQFQLKADLTLAQVIERARQAEVVAWQMNHQANRPNAQTANINTFKRKDGQYKKKAQHHDNSNMGAHSKEECGRCGKPQHSDERHCPALKSKCKRCSKKGHWEPKCYSKAVREVTSEQLEQTFFLGAVNREDKWTVGLPINNVNVTFKIDTGADATIIDQRTKLGPPDTRFVSPRGDLKCTEVLPCTTSYKGEKYSFNVHVIEGTSCLLGSKEAVKMGLVKRIEEVSGVFGSTGLLKTEPKKKNLKGIHKSEDSTGQHTCTHLLQRQQAHHRVSGRQQLQAGWRSSSTAQGPLETRGLLLQMTQ